MAFCSKFGGEDLTEIYFLTVVLKILEEIMYASPCETFGYFDLARKETHGHAFASPETEDMIADVFWKPDFNGAIS
ncbi:MAG: hypothetical protein WAU28_00265 [Candidatus Moraniibacteriota bacterium]